MLNNLWYVARPSAEVGSQPLAARLPGQDRVPFRGADGRVTRIPAGPGLKTPARVRVDACPTHQKHGWIWVFIGDLPESRRPAPPAMPECDDPSIRWIGGSRDRNANYQRVVENGLDFAHAPFVHGSASGDRNNPAIDDFSVEECATGARSRMVMRVPRNIRGLWSFLYREKLTVVESRPGYDVNGLVVGLELLPRHGWQVWLRSARTPVGENTTRTWWLMGRNFRKAAMFDQDSVKRNGKTFHQDTVVPATIKPEQLPHSWREALTVPTDALQVPCRRRVREFEARGWKVGTRRIDAGFRGRHACVLLSHGRPDKGQPLVPETVPFTGVDADPGFAGSGAELQDSRP